MTDHMQNITIQAEENPAPVTETPVTEVPAEVTAEETQQSLQQGGLLASVFRITVQLLSQFNFGRTILQALEQAKLKRQGQHIKAQISQIAEEGETAIVSIDVLDELDDMPVCTLELECEQVDPSLQPGQVIHNLMY